MDLIHEIIKQLNKIVSIARRNRRRKIKKYYDSIETQAESKRWEDVLNKISKYAPHQYGYKVDDNHSLLNKIKDVNERTWFMSIVFRGK